MEKITSESLNSLKLDLLKKLALEKEINVKKMKKKEIISAILEKHKNEESIISNQEKSQEKIVENISPLDRNNEVKNMAKNKNKLGIKKEKEVLPYNVPKDVKDDMMENKKEVEKAIKKPSLVELENQIESKLTTESENNIDDSVNLTNIPVDMISIDKLAPSEDNFFKGLSPEKFVELRESIKDNGVMMPLIVRPKNDGNFEILAGHNRARVCKELGIPQLPCRIVTVSDDRAKEIIVDTNVAQRDKLTPMELARAYSEKSRILGNRQGKRSDLGGQEEKGTTRDIVGGAYGVSGMTVARYMSLINLIKEFEDLLDKNEISQNQALTISKLNQENQSILIKLIKKEVTTLWGGNLKKVDTKKIKSIEKIQNKSENPGQLVTESQMLEVLQEGIKTKPKTANLKLSVEFDNTDEDFTKFVSELKPKDLMALLHEAFANKRDN